MYQADLKAELARKRLSQRELARRIGVKTTHLNEVLNGKARMTRRMARDIAVMAKLPMSVIQISENGQEEELKEVG